MKVFFAGDFCSKPSTVGITVSDELKSLIQGCDFGVINFEVPLKPDDTHLPPQNRERFFQNVDTVSFLRGLGFNLFQLANNHTFDWGEEGFRKTKAALGEDAFGAGTYDEAYKVKVVEKDGVKIGFLSLSFAAYTGVFDDVTKREGLGCAYIYDLRVNHVILEAKKSVDYLFVLPHDGIEYIDIPMPETMARYRDFIDYGADGVIGTHPHCPQGWEEYKGKPIFYSLGNLFFNSKETADFKCDKPHWYEGICVMVTIDHGNLTWKVVNTKNVTNTGLLLDHDVARDRHNETLCRYLTNKDEYNACLMKICDSLGKKEISIIDRTMHPQSLKSCTKLLVSLWLDKLFKKDKWNDNSLMRLLTHDQRRNLLLWTLRRRNNVC